MTEPSTIVVGNKHLPEFERARAWLVARGPMRFVESLDDVTGEEVDTLILVQERPGEHCIAQLEELLLRHPFARIVSFVGPWCDGELRSGRVWPGAVRVRWHAWEAELPAALEQAVWPRTANDADRWTAAVRVRSPRPMVVGVVTARAGDADALCDAVRACGGSPVWVSAAVPVIARSVAAVIFDLDGSQSSESAAIDLLQSAAAPPVLLLTAFPRGEEHEAWLARGARSVLAKPFLLPQLDQALAAVASDAKAAQTSAA